MDAFQGKNRLFFAARRVLWPLILYLLLTLSAESLLLLFRSLLPESLLPVLFGDYFYRNGPILFMVFVCALTFLFMNGMYRRDSRLWGGNWNGDWRGERNGDRNGRSALFADGEKVPLREEKGSLPLLITASVCAAIGGNILLQLSGLVRLFPGVTEVNESLAESELWLSLLYTIVIAAATEEFLFRGLIYRRLREELRFFPAAVISSFLFGLIHGNMMQFLYALSVGMLLAFFYERFRDLRKAALAHGLINAVSGYSVLFTAPVVTEKLPYLPYAAMGVCFVLLGFAAVQIGKRLPRRDVSLRQLKAEKSEEAAQ